MAQQEAGPAAGDGNPQDAQRQALRARLLQARATLADRQRRETALVGRLARWLKTMPVARLAFFWPIRDEPDLRPVVATWLGEDAARRAALPVMTGPTLEFAAWAPGAPMEIGPFGIAVPAGAARLQPQLLLVPCVGFDPQRYRLGYGGGYYDRTLAALKLRPVTVGVGFDCGRLPSIGPQPHDIRLDLVVTESGVL